MLNKCIADAYENYINGNRKKAYEQFTSLLDSEKLMFWDELNINERVLFLRFLEIKEQS